MVSFGKSGGGSSTSKPLSGRERADIFDWGIKAIGSQLPGTSSGGGVVSDEERYAGTSGGGGFGGSLLGAMKRKIASQNDPGDVPMIDFPEYQAPEYRGLAEGDYDRLEDNIFQSAWSPVERFADLERGRIDQSLADRGLYSSGIAEETQQDFTEERLLPVLQKAAADAATQRYGLQFEDLGRQNAFEMDTADREFDSGWAPLEYLLGLFNQTGGAVSRSKQDSGFSFGIG